MKSILFLCESLGIGGAEKALYTLLTHIDKNKFDITVCSLCDTGHYSKLIKQIPNIKYRSILFPRDTGFKGLLYKLKYQLIYKILPPSLIYKLFIPKNNTVEIAFCEGFSTKIIANSSNKNSKKIAWVHTDLLKNNWPVFIAIYKDINEEVSSYSKFNSIIGVSNSVSNNLRQLLHNKTAVHTLYNLIDEVAILNQAVEDIDYKFNNSSINIISVGRLEYVKGYDRLINICSRLINNDNLNITLTIVGNGTQFNNLSELIKQLNISSKIKLLGTKQNPYPYIKTADLYVCPSRDEGYNIALAEAITLGKPCISTNCSGPDEILENGKYGCLVKNDEDSLYFAIKEICLNHNKLKLLSDLSIERRQFFNLSKNLGQIESLISQ